MVRLRLMPAMRLYWFCLYTSMAYALLRTAKKHVPLHKAFLGVWVWPFLLLAAIASEVAKGTKELFSKRT